MPVRRTHQSRQSKACRMATNIPAPSVWMYRLALSPERSIEIPNLVTTFSYTSSPDMPLNIGRVLMSGSAATQTRHPRDHNIIHRGVSGKQSVLPRSLYWYNAAVRKWRHLHGYAVSLEIAGTLLNIPCGFTKRLRAFDIFLVSVEINARQFARRSRNILGCGSAFSNSDDKRGRDVAQLVASGRGEQPVDEPLLAVEQVFRSMKY